MESTPVFLSNTFSFSFPNGNIGKYERALGKKTALKYFFFEMSEMLLKKMFYSEQIA